MEDIKESYKKLEEEELTEEQDTKIKSRKGMTPKNKKEKDAPQEGEGLLKKKVGKTTLELKKKKEKEKQTKEPKTKTKWRKAKTCNDVTELDNTFEDLLRRNKIRVHGTKDGSLFPEKEEENVVSMKNLLIQATKEDNVDRVKSCLKHNVFHLNTIVDDPVLHIAAENGNLDLVKIFLKQGADVNQLDDLGQTALYRACAKGREDVVKFLLKQKGINAYIRTYSDESPYEVTTKPALKKLFVQRIAKAIEEGYIEEATLFSMARAFLDKKAESSSFNFLMDKQDNTILHVAVERERWEIVNILLKEGADVNAKRKDGRTSLHLACKIKNPIGLEQLLEKGADRTIQDDEESTPVDYAMVVAKKTGNNKWVKLLEGPVVPKEEEKRAKKKIPKGKKIPKEKEAVKGADKIVLAARAGDFGGVKASLSETGVNVNSICMLDKKKFSALHWACFNSNYDIASLLLRHNDVDVNFQDPLEKNTPLHLLLGWRRDQMKTSTKLKHDKLVADFIKRKDIQWDTMNNQNATWVHYLVHYLGSSTSLMVTKLLAKKKSPHDYVKLCGKKQGTVLHVAAAAGNLDLVKIFLKHGADVNQLDPNGQTPLHDACANGHIDVVKFLLKQKGVNVYIRSNSNESPYDVTTKPALKKLFVKRIVKAIEEGDDDEVKKFNGNPFVIDKSGDTVLHLAIKTEQWKIVDLLLQAERRANVNAKGMGGMTALHLVCKMETPIGLKQLLDKGGDRTIQDDKKKTPADYAKAMARKTGNFRWVELLGEEQKKIPKNTNKKKKANKEVKKITNNRNKINEN
jgi:ankyrin repeat protein